MRILFSFGIHLTHLRHMNVYITHNKEEEKQNYVLEKEKKEKKISSKMTYYLS